MMAFRRSRSTRRPAEQRVRAGNRDDRIDLIRVENGPLERLHPAKRPAGDGGQSLNPELVGNARCVHHVGDGNDGKVHAERFPDAGFTDEGPVVPRQPPSRLVDTTK